MSLDTNSSPSCAQPIEHAHGRTKMLFASRFWADPSCDTIDKMWDLWRECWAEKNSAQAVCADVYSLPETWAKVVEADGGRIARHYR